MSYSDTASEFVATAKSLIDKGNLYEAISKLGLSILCEERANTFLMRAQLYAKLPVPDIEKAMLDVEKVWLLRSQGHAVNDYELKNLERSLAKFLVQWNEQRDQRHHRKSLAELRDLDGLLSDLNLLDQKDLITQAACQSLRITFHETTEKNNISRLGGTPWVPVDFIWPKNVDGGPLPFLLQISIAELLDAMLDSKVQNTHSGLILIFYDMESQSDFRNVKEDRAWSVIVLDDLDKLKPATLPEDLSPAFNLGIFTARFQRELTFPDRIETLTAEDRRSYNEFLELWYGEPVIHRIFGHAQTLQGDLEHFVPKLEKIREPKQQFQMFDTLLDKFSPSRDPFSSLLLLQIDSDSDLGLQFGLSGRLYLTITRSDFIAGLLANALVELQST